MMATLYEVDVRTINYHIKKIFADSELQELSVIRKFRITAEIAKAKAETEFDKYRVIQDKLFLSDFDKYMLELEEAVTGQDEKD